MNKNFETLSNPLFKKVDSNSAKNFRGGLQDYTVVWTHCSETLWGADSRCTDEKKDVEPAD